MSDKPELKPVLELRVTLTVPDYERLVEFYCDGLGISPAQFWDNEQGRGTILEMGRASLELFNEQQAGTVDQIEVGQRVSGPVRLAMKVPDLESAMNRLAAKGAKIVHPPVITPWGDRNVRLKAPDGMQITLFQEA